MMGLLGESGQKDHPRLAHKLQFALDTDTLWYARSELMHALAMQYGERRAQSALRNLEPLFRK